MDKNPKLLKIARDLANGKSSKKKAGPVAGTFNNFAPSGNDWDELAMQIMEAQDKNQNP